MKDEHAVNPITVTKLFKKMQSGSKNLDNQARSGRPKTVNSEAVLQTIEANPVCLTLRESGELYISQYRVVGHFYYLSAKSIRSCRIMPYVQPKYCKTFYSSK